MNIQILVTQHLTSKTLNMEMVTVSAGEAVKACMLNFNTINTCFDTAGSSIYTYTKFIQIQLIPQSLV